MDETKVLTFLSLALFDFLARARTRHCAFFRLAISSPLRLLISFKEGGPSKEEKEKTRIREDEGARCSARMNERANAIAAE